MAAVGEPLTLARGKVSLNLSYWFVLHSFQKINQVFCHCFNRCEEGYWIAGKTSKE